eukprot:5726149-Prymnesium_polylepis.1
MEGRMHTVREVPVASAAAKVRFIRMVRATQALTEEGEIWPLVTARDGDERGPGRARRAGTGRMNLVGLRAFESPGAPRPLQRTHT